MVRGEVWFANLSGDGSVQRGIRPVVIVSNNRGNRYAPIVIVAPITSAVKKPLPTHVTYWHVRKDGWTVRDTILCENLQAVDKSMLLNDSPVGVLTTQQMQEVDRALEIALGLDPKFNKLEEEVYVSEDVRNPVVDSGSCGSAPMRYKRPGSRYSLYGISPAIPTDNCPESP